MRQTMIQQMTTPKSMVREISRSIGELVAKPRCLSLNCKDKLLEKLKQDISSLKKQR